MAAPIWASFAALLNQAQGSNLGFLNPRLYALSGSGGFHSAPSLSSDFAQVGLGSPNLNVLFMQLSGQVAGAVSPTVSSLGASVVNPSGAPPSGIADDGATTGNVTVFLRDANGNSIAGKTVKLAANSGASVMITPANAVTTADNGAAEFSITDTVAENLTFTATDTTDGVTLSQTLPIDFIVAPGVSAGLQAFPLTVTADGMTPTAITLTLEDSLGRPTPGKTIKLSQTGGSSVISGPNPPVTNASGQIEFTAVDSNNETITYSAVDVTDGNLPFPTTATVTFNSSPQPGCSNTMVAAPGFVAQPYATGFPSHSFCAAGLCNEGCPGAFGLAFDASGNLYVADQPTGDVYKIPPGGGVANSSTLLTQTAIPTLLELAVGSGGNLYAGVNEAGALYSPGGGEVVRLNTTTGAISGTVATGITCPGLIAIDPLSGDLFTDANCFGDAGGGELNNASSWRISDLSGPSPSVSVYATLPGSPNGSIAFAPNGTIYVTTTPPPRRRSARGGERHQRLSDHCNHSHESPGVRPWVAGGGQPSRWRGRILDLQL
jgi:hypothetical protein